MAVAVLAAALAVTGSATNGASATAPASGAAEPPSAAKIKPELARQLEDKDSADFWVRFKDRPDLSAATATTDWDKRGQAVYDVLTEAATASQKETRSLLDGEGVTYQAFWATNAIRIDAGSTALAGEIAASSEVEALYATREYAVEKPVKGENTNAPAAVEWGIADINADDVWSEYGDTGTGIVIGNIDTGVDYTHPALAAQYRGNNGDGTVDNNYNWFDAAGTCGDAPCDVEAHGTHTMGTMVGDDGTGNQIGVAPGATWIAANGCCPSDAALISSSEWMLAPTDLAGENPDVTKRPNVINNSWGTTVPTNDPFMEDIQLAWSAAGIFGSWSNGNSGPGCQSSGAPGSRIINYSVGAYGSDGAIAGFSARGAGQDGETKPNIAAPGVNVRSSIPGGGYDTYSGTSMAAPHLAGTVALLWSAAPSLIGDIEGTRALLNGSAIDTDDDSCGGTAEDNNVFGEGRLDALALLDSAPVGDTGTIAGEITDGGTGDPVAGAVVTIDGEFDRSVTTDAAGAYSVRIAVGDYAVTVSKFGYVSGTSEATVSKDQTTSASFALESAASVTLSGTVTDGAEHGWPLYAEVSIAGAPTKVFTDPATGAYSVAVPDGATYAVTVESAYEGYLPTTQDVTVGATDTTADFGIEVDSSTCVAAGYAFDVNGVTESFDGVTMPEGWTVEDSSDPVNGQVWSVEDAKNRGNLTGGEGGFAIVDSDGFGAAGQQDTSLVSPVVDMTDLSAPVLGLAQDFQHLGDVADIDLSIDGGTTWETVAHQGTSLRGPRSDVLQLPTAAGEPEVQVRFHYVGSYDWWWQVDDVFIGNRTCAPIPGGLVVGNVSGASTGADIAGATVTSLDAPEEKTTTSSTPDDAAVGDGFFWMFSTLTGVHPFAASASNFETVESSIDVAADGATASTFELGSGHLTLTPGSVAITRQLGKPAGTKTFEVTNDGTIPVDLEFSERKGGFELQGADGSRTDTSAVVEQEGAPLQSIKAPVSLAATGAAPSMGTNAAPVAGPNEAPWTDIADYPAVVMDNRVVYLDGIAYSVGGGDGNAATASLNAYDPATLSWTAKADLPGARNAVAAAVVDAQIVVTGGWADSGPSPTTFVYDVAGDAWTAKADAPLGLAASGQAVVDGVMYTIGGCTTDNCTPMSSSVAAYDAAADTWTTLADYPLAVAFASCGGIDGLVYCTGGNAGAAGTADSYSYDPAADAWTPIADAPVATWASANAVANGTLVVNGGVQGTAITNRTFAFDPTTAAWVDMPNTNTAVYRGGAACGVYKVGGSSGGFAPTVDSEQLPGFEDCGASAADVEWLSVAPAAATLAPGQSVTVRVTMDPSVAQPGVYTGGIGIKENTPGTLEPVTATMTVTPPTRWGKLVGTIRGTTCAGVANPITGATLSASSLDNVWTFQTGTDGKYASWFDSYYSPLQLISAKDGYVPQARNTKVVKGKITTADFTLKKTGC